MASKPSNFPLDISKLNFVLQVLRHYKFPEARWFEFGLNLGLLHPTLEAIESAHRGNPSRCLMECLTKWLTKADDNVTTVGPIIWKTLANALRGMNATSISTDIRKTMADPVSEILQCYIGRLAQVVLTEESVDLLHTEGLISKDTLTKVKSCGCSLVGDPMLLILSAVAEDHSNLRDYPLLSSLVRRSSFVLKWNPSEHSLSSIRALLWKTFKDNQVEVVVIKEGNSIIVTCYAPHYLMESLLVTARDNVDLLKEMGLISLTIGYYTVYDEHGIDEEVKSLMKKLEMVESERDDLLEENAKLKGTIDTLGISYEGREFDESNKSSIQSSESEKEESKKKMTKAMQMEIDHLRSSLVSKTGIEETLIEREKVIEQLQEKISLMNIQQLKETSITLRKDQSTQSIDPPKGPVYVAMYSREARESGELPIKKGEKLEIKEERTEGWCLARSLDTDQEGDVHIALIKKDEESELSTLESLELFHYAMTENVDIPKIKEIKTRSNVERASLFLSLIKQDSVLLDQLRKEHGKPKAIRWYDDGVQLTSPSLIQCQEVVSLLTYKHTTIVINKSSPDVVCDLLPVLLQNEKVEYLRIQDTQLTQDCISSLCNLLANNKSLLNLFLINCSIDDKAVADITNVLQTHNNTLFGLFFLKNPRITSVSAQSLSELIINNSTLTELQIGHNSISSDGILLILQSLTINKNINLFLDLKHKDICTEYHDYNVIKDRVIFYN
ncbi:PREDICTED: uncharacterized protein LOC109586504 [Amphimedon queenslandica]|uniref:SH3 domain-containing protein n=1 Tax=Amphimedon queenslandica TaxID=400682 RepID=A0AAN0JN63_AMPQE|nr:PREDICTED: uncharacterized protein LOC109586504 [Amphimedon queenslandica]|eukprot:XP_019858256.1 PREDICTED: uncharacterized protein LOC109586504 [Amphimedon queenslandica]